MTITINKFRSPKNNGLYTIQLFWDHQQQMPEDRKLIEPMYTLHNDVKGMINFRKEYIRDMDPTGFKTANRLLENYEHWNLLMRTKWFREVKAEWDKELAAKMDADATDVLKEIMKGGDDIKTSERIAAAKVMLGKAKALGPKPETSKRGRPSTDEVNGELKEQARLTKEEQEDLKRIRSIK